MTATLHGGPYDGDSMEAQGASQLLIPSFPVDFDDMTPGVIYDGRFNVYDLRRASGGRLHGWYIGERTPREL